MGNQASHLEAEVAKLKSEGDPEQLVVARQQAEKELNELQEGLAKSQHQERHRLQTVNWVQVGAAAVGQVSYEHGYRVALARFLAWYPNMEVDNDPFTEKPEDSLVPMETRQEFDDSILLEE
ncbi:hypothetical protein B296_00004813 [Ensete ventricosum]|uniref:Uncharacterized protein n=1 Tax=Ensete ventricosum TaxID=4639 RepID=A0A427A1K9_ENSVE|nr:hypothetical protein B296_00004813 [Ensete ventricosum]